MRLGTHGIHLTRITPNCQKLDLRVPFEAHARLAGALRKNTKTQERITEIGRGSEGGSKRSPNRILMGPPPTAGEEPLPAAAEGPLCCACKARKPRRSFSRAQLKKRASAGRRCYHCLGAADASWSLASACWVCLEGAEPGRRLVSTGCGCRRGTGGYVHLGCAVANAAMMQEQGGGWGVRSREVRGPFKTRLACVALSIRPGPEPHPHLG